MSLSCTIMRRSQLQFCYFSGEASLFDHRPINLIASIFLHHLTRSSHFFIKSAGIGKQFFDFFFIVYALLFFATAIEHTTYSYGWRTLSCAEDGKKSLCLSTHRTAERRREKSLMISIDDNHKAIIEAITINNKKIWSRKSLSLLATVIPVSNL